VSLKNEEKWRGINNGFPFPFQVPMDKKQKQGRGDEQCGRGEKTKGRRYLKNG